MIPRVWENFISPDCTKLTSITVVALLDWINIVTKPPIIKAVILFRVRAARMDLILFPAAFFMPSLIEEMNRPLQQLDGKLIKRPVNVFNLDQADSCRQFLEGDYKTVPIYRTDENLTYDAMRSVGVGLSVLGTSHAIALGAYAVALHELDEQRILFVAVPEADESKLGSFIAKIKTIIK